MTLYTTLRDALHLPAHPGDEDIVFRRALNDSRKVESGDLFVAIPGSRADGRAYIEQAVSRGAAVVLYGGEADLTTTCPIPCRRVPDAYEAFAEACRTAGGFPDRALKLVGVTGTNGKTTTAYLVERLLRSGGIPCGLISTVEYRDGEKSEEADRTTPDAPTLVALFDRMRRHQLRAAAMELSSHSLAQSRCGHARFAVSIFTNLTGDHLDYHKTMTAYYEAKKRLFFELTAPDGMRFVHLGDQWSAQLVRELREARLPVTTFGDAPECDVLLEQIELREDGCAFRLGNNAYRSNLAGRYNVSNLAGAILSAQFLGVSHGSIARTLAAGIRIPGRLECLAFAGNRRCFVDYAHTDDALEKALTALGALVKKPGKLTVLFGCGGDRDRTKRPRMGRVAAQLADRVIVTSDNPRSEDPGAIIGEIVGGQTGFVIEPDRGKAIEQAVLSMAPGDILLVAGKGHEKTQTIGQMVLPFDDVLHVQRAIDQFMDAKG